MIVASKNTRVEVVSKSIPTFRKVLNFPATLHCILENLPQQTTIKVEKGLETLSNKRLQQKKTWTCFFVQINSIHHL